MNGLKKNFKNAHILIVGSGIVGKFNALELSKKGFKITIADQQKKKNPAEAMQINPNRLKSSRDH